MPKMKDKVKEKAIERLIDEIGQLEEKIKSDQVILDINKATLLSELKNINYSDEPDFKGEKFKVRVITRTSINYDAYKIEDKLDKNLAKQFISKNYNIIDYEGFAKTLKEAGFNAKNIKKFISVDKKVDKLALENLAKQEIVDVKDLKGCYIVSQSEYLKFNKLGG